MILVGITVSNGATVAAPSQAGLGSADEQVTLVPKGLLGARIDA